MLVVLVLTGLVMIMVYYVLSHFQAFGFGYQHQSESTIELSMFDHRFRSDLWKADSVAVTTGKVSIFKNRKVSITYQFEEGVTLRNEVRQDTFLVPIRELEVKEGSRKRYLILHSEEDAYWYAVKR